MYTRSYYDNSDRGVPKDYDGTAFRNDDEKVLITPTYGESKVSPEYSEIQDEACGISVEEEKEGFISRLFSRDTFKKLPFGALDSLKRVKENFSLEEIIIVATALLLLFSKEGDILLGLALLCLLFVR